MVDESFFNNILNFFSNLINSILPDFIGKAIIAIIILLVGFVIGKLIGKLVKKVLSEFELNKILKSMTGMKVKAEEIITVIVTYLIYFLTVVMALNQLGLTTIVLYMIAGAIIIFLIISWLLAIKDFLPNVFAGLFLNRSQFIKIGDKVRFNNVEGEIVQLTLIETRMKNKDGDIISIPNSKLTKEQITKLRPRKIKKNPKHI